MIAIHCKENWALQYDSQRHIKGPSSIIRKYQVLTSKTRKENDKGNKKRMNRYRI